MITKQTFFIFLVYIALLASSTAFADVYPEATDVLQQLAEQVVTELDSKAVWRFVFKEPGGKEYRKIPWVLGDRQTVAVYLFREEGTKEVLPFGIRLQKQLGVAMDRSNKFMYVMRDMDKFYDMKKRETDFMINEETAAAVGRVLGARYFLTGTYWLNGNETVIQAALWDAETATAIHAQNSINGWEWPLVRERLVSGWWKGGIGFLSLLVMLGVIRFLNRSVFYNLRSRENKTVYILIQLGFGLAFLSVGYLFVEWWAFPV